MVRSGLLDLQRYEREFGKLHEGAAKILHMTEEIDKGIPDLIPAESVDHQNSLQVQYASRFIISPFDEFDLARKMIDDNGKLKEPPGFTVW